MTATATTFEAGTTVQIDPSTLLLERNIRETVLDPAFVASVKAVGVLEPIVAVVNTGGQLVVRFGHRRTLAAVEAGVATVPVYVTGGDDRTEPAEIDRVIRQHDENTQRRPLTAAEQLGVVEQLGLFGLSAAQITKRARITRRTVDAAMATAGSELARKAAEKYEALTLDQAAVVAEFEDEPEVAKALIVAAVDRPEQFGHVAQRQRDERTEREAIAAARAELEAAGVKVIDKPDWQDKTKRLDYLKVSAGGAKLTEVNHAKCPGHVAWVEFSGWSEDGKTREYGPEYGCGNPAKHGHYNTMSSGSSSSRPKADDLTAEQREANRAARRLVIDNNKAWASATAVRRTWLAEFATGKTAPKGAAAFIARAIEQNYHGFNDLDGSKLASQWLGVKGSEGYGRSHLSHAAGEASEDRALMIALIQVLAAYEASSMSEQTWRTDGKNSHGGHYLRFLESAGYGLSDVEKFAVSSRTA